MAIGGMKGLPGMPSSKGGGLGSSGQRISQHGAKPPRIGAQFTSNQGAGFNNKGPSGLNAFSVPKYGAGGGIGGGIGGGLGGGLGSYGSSSGLGGLGGGIGASGFNMENNNIGSSQSKRGGSRGGSKSGIGRHKY